MRYGLYLTTGKNPKGDGLLAIISDGSPQRGHKKVRVLTLEVLPDTAAAVAWFERMKVEQPWEQRQ